MVRRTSRCMWRHIARMRLSLCLVGLCGCHRRTTWFNMHFMRHSTYWIPPSGRLAMNAVQKYYYYHHQIFLVNPQCENCLKSGRTDSLGTVTPITHTHRHTKLPHNSMFTQLITTVWQRQCLVNNYRRKLMWSFSWRRFERVASALISLVCARYIVSGSTRHMLLSNFQSRGIVSSQTDVDAWSNDCRHVCVCVLCVDAIKPST